MKSSIIVLAGILCFTSCWAQRVTTSDTLEWKGYEGIIPFKDGSFVIANKKIDFLGDLTKARIYHYAADLSAHLTFNVPPALLYPDQVLHDSTSDLGGKGYEKDCL